jgi:hypothetical protein
MSNYDLLINKFIEKTISSEERIVLEKWVFKNDANKVIFKKYIKSATKKSDQGFDTDLAYQKFSETIKSKKKATNAFYNVLKYAAVVVILLTTGFLVKQQFSNDDTNATISVIDKQEALPEGNEIIIKMADGTTKILNSNGSDAVTDINGKVIANQGGNSMVFNNGNELTETQAIFNEVYIPYGQTFKLTLSDGTLVWLNAGSKLRFPQKFIDSDKERIVYLEGEGFFEVAKNKEVPFIVNTQEVDIKVLGTKFNISSYETDHSIATTLVEGSVSVYETRMPENNLLLIPNFQASYNKFKNDFSKKEVDTKMFTAWMEDRFVIDNLTFSEILVKLERRHHVKFVNNTKNLGDEIYKGEFENEGIESILETISLSTPFEYEIQHNIITIN